MDIEDRVNDEAELTLEHSTAVYREDGAPTATAAPQQQSRRNTHLRVTVVDYNEADAAPSDTKTPSSKVTPTIATSGDAVGLVAPPSGTRTAMSTTPTFPHKVRDFPLQKAMTNTSAHNTIFQAMQQLWAEHQNSVDVPRELILAHIIRTHGTPWLITVACFLFVLMLPESYSFAYKFTSTFVFGAIVVAFTVIEGLFIWARAVEIRYRCLMAVHDFVSHRSCGFAGQMKGLRGLTTAHSFRPQHAIRDGKLQVIPKALVVHGDVVLDMRKMQYKIFNDSIGCCKLYDCLLLAICGEARMLLPLKDVRRSHRPKYTVPHSFPQQRHEEHFDSSDESDVETASRSTTIGGALPSIPRQMEYFVRRVLLLIWFGLLVVLVLVGIARGVCIGAVTDNLMFYPCICVLPLLPLNAMLLHRVLTLFGNAVLSLRTKWLIEQEESQLHEECEVPNIPVWDIAQELRSLVFSLKKGRNGVMCFSRSPLETFGTVTIVAMADTEGILTDLVPIPQMILLINKNEYKDYGGSSTSTSDDEVENTMEVDYLAQVREAKMRMHLQKRRKLFQEDRFTQLDLHVSAMDDLAVEFLDDRLKQVKLPCLHPMALCALLHSVHSSAFSADVASATIRHVDKTILWARCLHWLPRALNFDDVIACQYRLVRRILVVSSVGSGKTDQCCGLLFLFENDFHLFTVSSLRMALPRCSSYWTGMDIEEFDEEEKRELFTVANDHWGKRQLTAICLSHRVLPERYRKYIEVSDRIAEDVFFNGQLLTDTVSDRSSDSSSDSDSGSVSTTTTEGASEDDDENTAKGLRRKRNSSLSSSSLKGSHRQSASTPSKSSCGKRGSRSSRRGRRRQRSGAAHRNHRRTNSDSAAYGPTTGKEHTTARRAAMLSSDLQHRRAHSQYDSESEVWDSTCLQKDAIVTSQNFVKSLMSCDQTLLGIVGLRELQADFRYKQQQQLYADPTAGIPQLQPNVRDDDLLHVLHRLADKVNSVETRVITMTHGGSGPGAGAAHPTTAAPAAAAGTTSGIDEKWMRWVNDNTSNSKSRSDGVKEWLQETSNK